MNILQQKIMIPLTIKTLAHKGAPDRLHKDGIDNLRMRYGLEPELSDQPIVLMFLTGGSEAEAVKNLQKEKYQVLLAAGKTNAFASAMEVKAYSNMHGYRNVLLNMDDANDSQLFQEYIKVFNALEGVKGKRLGLVGEVSDWLVASSIDPEILKERLGVELVSIPWDKAGDFHGFEAETKFMECYRGGKHYNIEDAGKVHSLLIKVIDDHKLDAITVECFSLVQENDVTACLGLSFLNDLGIPAGCEGDLCSISGMMIAKELYGQLPWMANIASIQGNELLFAHCTAPTNILSEHHINTHFETGKGTAIHGRFNVEDVTVFRLNSSMEKVFHAHGKVVVGMYEKHACRTQLHVEFDPEVIKELKENPLGNHHLIIPGDKSDELSVFANILGL